MENHDREEKVGNKKVRLRSDFSQFFKASTV